VRWQYADLLDWEKSTPGTELPLVTNMLKNDAYIRYYLDHVEHMLDTSFNERAVTAAIEQLWPRVEQPAFLESDTPTGAPHTGRQFTNDQVYWNGYKHHELSHAGAHIDGILHYVRMRHAAARRQLAELRPTYPSGSSGATFPATPAAPPPAN